MDKVLQLCDSDESTYPRHFETFLDNCLTRYGGHFGENDYLFAAVYFLVLETGFMPEDTADDTNGVDFNVRNLRRVTGYDEGQLRTSKPSCPSRYFIYQIPLRLGQYKSSMCELIGVPSAEVNSHLMVNFRCEKPYIVQPLCLNTESYIQKTDSPETKHKYRVINVRELSNAVKNDLALFIKDSILMSEGEGCSTNLLCLPEEIQKKIVHSLKRDPISVQYLSSTCTYFYDLIKRDTKLWEDMCFQEYDGWLLRKALRDTNAEEDSNVFRTVFLNLKNKVRYSYSFANSKNLVVRNVL